MNWDWIAGFFEGEGHIYWQEGKKGTKRGTSGRILIGQKVKDPLDAINTFFLQEGLKRPILYWRPPAKSARSSGIWMLVLNVREDVILFLEHTRDHLFDKQAKADFVLTKLIQLNKERQDAIDKAISLRVSKATWPEIARLTGCKRRAITNHMRAAGLDWRSFAKWPDQYSWRLDRIAQGLCGCCGAPRGENTISKLYCDSCQEKRRVLVRSWKAKRRAAGLAV